MQVRIDAALTVILSFNGMPSNIPSFALKFNLLGLRSALQGTTRYYKVPRFMNPPAYLHAAQHNKGAVQLSKKSQRNGQGKKQKGKEGCAWQHQTLFMAAGSQRVQSCAGVGGRSEK